MRVSYTQTSPLARGNEACSISPLSAERKKRNVEVDEESYLETDRRLWRTVSLGSRKQLCINDDIISKPGDLDEKCRELQDGQGACLMLTESFNCECRTQGKTVSISSAPRGSSSFA